MPEKEALAEWGRQCLPYISTLFLSCWGGTVSYIQRMRVRSRKFSWKELGFDLTISSFAGLLTHFFCEYANLSGALASILIAISAHMGTRAIASFERIHSRVFDDNDPANNSR